MATAESILIATISPTTMETLTAIILMETIYRVVEIPTLTTMVAMATTSTQILFPATRVLMAIMESTMVARAMCLIIRIATAIPTQTLEVTVTTTTHPMEILDTVMETSDTMQTPMVNLSQTTMPAILMEQKPSLL
ncbi:hypothetical protein BD560DRAFT_383069 [Blakeslea trispora]|nr:hypothetical protein BD560DRAFT_383069 [Blakeslea trispora]